MSDQPAGSVAATSGNGGNVEKIKIEQHSLAGTLWFALWLFTIGFLHLTFWQGILAIVLWPYDIGVRFSSLVR
jgi:hypothetical protein